MSALRIPFRVPVYWVLSALAFLLALGTGGVLAWSLETAAPEVNVAGRQRMYLQKMAVEALYIAHEGRQGVGAAAPRHSKEMDAARGRLRRTVARFEDAHHELLEGRPRRGVAAISDAEARKQLGRVGALWQEYRELLVGFLEGDAVSHRQVEAVATRSREILMAMDTAVARIQDHAIGEIRHHRWLALGLVAAVSLLLLLAAWAGWVQRRLERQAFIDPLTGLSSRAWFDPILEEEQERARRDGSTFALVLFDLDHFKQINDQLGHEAGDRVLARVAELLRAELRKADVVCRWGGEELAVLMPETGLDEAQQMAERLRVEVGAAFEEEVLPVTISAGVAVWTPGEDSQAVMRRADSALYRAKSEGRNRISSTPLTPQPPAGEEVHGG